MFDVPTAKSAAFDVLAAKGSVALKMGMLWACAKVSP
jgi:hypothetical protein